MNNQQRIGIIGAMQVEVNALIAHMTRGQVVQRCGMLFAIGSLGKHEVVAACGGVGKVNVAVCTQILIDEFEVAAVVNTGVAGALDDRLAIGDVVIATDAVQYDVAAGPVGYPEGQIPQMDVFAFPVDERLAAAARAAAEAEGVKMLRGRVASGDQFVATKERREWIASTFGALCCEMEGASVAQVCYLNRVPCLVVRAISDLADPSSETDYNKHEESSADVSARVVERMIAELDRSVSSAVWGLGRENDLQ